MYTTLSRWNAAFLTWNEAPHRPTLLESGIRQVARSRPPREPAVLLIMVAFGARHQWLQRKSNLHRRANAQPNGPPEDLKESEECRERILKR